MNTAASQQVQELIQVGTRRNGKRLISRAMAEALSCAQSANLASTEQEVFPLVRNSQGELGIRIPEVQGQASGEVARCPQCIDRLAAAQSDTPPADSQAVDLPAD